MNGSKPPDRKRHGLFAVAALMILIGIVAVFGRSRHFFVEPLGLIMMLAGVYLVKLSNVYGLMDYASGGNENGKFAATSRPSRMMWAVGVVLLVMTGASYCFLHEAAIDGGHHAWPVYAFAGVGLVSGLFWSYLITKLFWSK